MKIYAINNANEAKQISQLLKLNAECAKLHWSTTIKGLPKEVVSSLETLEAFVETKVNEVCTSKNLIGSLTDQEESEIITILRKNPELKATLGLGVVMAGKEAEAVATMLEGKQIPVVLESALQSGKNIIIF